MKRLLPALAVLAACRGSSEPAPAGDAGIAVPVVETVAVVARPLDAVVSLEGELSPFERVAIHARASAFVARVLVDRGSHVKQGQVLAVLSAPELGAQRAEAEAKLVGERATYEHLKAAAATPGAIAGHEVENAEAAFRAAEGHVGALRALEQYLTITAPFEGVITERGVHPGALVGPQVGTTTPLFRLEQVEHLRLTVAVPESLLGGVVEGARATFAVRSFPGTKFEGVTRRTAGSLDPRTRTMPVELDVENADGRLAPGMFASVAWPVRRTAPSLFVPASAVGQSTERTFVVRIKDRIAEPVTVQRGVAQGELVEIFGELAAGDTVAARASDDLRSGTVVEARARR